MATNTERLDKLDDQVNYLQMQEKLFAQKLEQTQDTLGAHTADVVRYRDEVQKLQTAVSILRAEVDDLKKSRDTWGHRGWQIAAGVLLAVVGGVVGYLLKR